MALVRTSPPASTAVSLEEARAYARVASGEDDALLSLLLGSAVRRVEQATGRALLRQALAGTAGRLRGSASAFPVRERLCARPSAADQRGCGPPAFGER